MPHYYYVYFKLLIFVSFFFFSFRHMNTIELQLEVTRFLHRCENAASSKAPQTNPSSPSSLPTLFGGSPMKVEVACKVRLRFFCFFLEFYKVIIF